MSRVSAAADDSSRRLTPRQLGRTAEVLVPPVIWRAGGDVRDDDVVERAIEAGADWFFVPADQAIGDALLRPICDGEAELIVGVSLDSLLQRRTPPIFERLPGRACGGVMLQEGVATDLKGGRPFHRLMQLRDAGRARLILLEAADVAEAEWMVDHTPAQAVSLPYGLIDQTARYRVLPAAAENGTALLAREPESPPAWEHDPIDPLASVAFGAAESPITSLLQPLPRDRESLDQILASIRNPMPDEQRQRWWEAFSKQVPEPPKPRGAHPPEYGA
jgi:hypothetical protein